MGELRRFETRICSGRTPEVTRFYRVNLGVPRAQVVLRGIRRHSRLEVIPRESDSNVGFRVLPQSDPLILGASFFGRSPACPRRQSGLSGRL